MATVIGEKPGRHSVVTIQVLPQTAGALAVATGPGRCLHDRYTALQVFRQAAELGSFAATARRLGLSPAAVSKNIAELEAHAGARLIHRTTRRMALTEEGRTYLAHIVRGLDALCEADPALPRSPPSPAPCGSAHR